MTESGYGGGWSGIPYVPQRLVLRCAGCGAIFGMVEPGNAAYGKAPVFACSWRCLETAWLRHQKEGPREQSS